MPTADKLAKLNSINPGLMTISIPMKPTITADHLLIPTFSSNIIGDKIAQLVVIKTPLLKVVESDQLDSSDRGAGGFGSSGR